jgi:hypothetical protein
MNDGPTPSRGFVNDFIMLPEVVFDASEPPGAPTRAVLTLGLTFDSPPPITQAVRDVLNALDVHERLLGGQGLKIDPQRSSAGTTWLTVALRPNNETDAWPRLSEIVKKLAAEIDKGINGAAHCSAAPATSGTDLLSLLTWQAQHNGAPDVIVSEAVDLAMARHRVTCHGVHFVVMLDTGK